MRLYHQIGFLLSLLLVWLTPVLVYEITQGQADIDIGLCASLIFGFIMSFLIWYRIFREFKHLSQLKKLKLYGSSFKIPVRRIDSHEYSYQGWTQYRFSYISVGVFDCQKLTSLTLFRDVLSTKNLKYITLYYDEKDLSQYEFDLSEFKKLFIIPFV